MSDAPRFNGTRHEIPASLAHYEPGWGATGVDYDAMWESRRDGSHLDAERMRTHAYLVAWHQMRLNMPREHWSIEACDAIAESVLRTVRDWIEAP